MQTWKNLLKNLGFGESESKIYLASLEMGPKPVQDLAKKVEVSRMTAYSVIESLTEKGLMSSIQKGKKTLYAAESPDRLLSFLQDKIRKMESTMKEVEKTIKDLSQLQSGEKPVVKMFEGFEALKAIQDDIVKSNTRTFDEIGNIDEINKIYDEKKDLLPFLNFLDKASIKRRGIALREDHSKSLTSEHFQRLALDNSKFNFTGDIVVYGKKVALSSFGTKQFSVIIESESIADTIRALFTLALDKKKPQ